ncbi:MAG: hypothetical protein NC388_10775 [Clostridium sp.]|nr:hypothetical protein [Clostridium sp.]
MMKSFIRYMLCGLLVTCLAACSDDFSFGAGEVPAGESLVTATVDFMPMSATLTGRTRSAGNSLDDINSLFVLLYDEKGALVESYKVDNYSKMDEDRTNADAENNKTAESQTLRATFSLQIPYGIYHMYAVANVPDLLTNEDYAEALQTIDGLKRIPLTWQTEADRMAENGQMMGYFTTAALQTDEAEPLVIDRRDVSLHAWLRRAASKVTVRFDGTGLNEGVFVYIRSVQIKDIPTQCYLGSENNVGGDRYVLSDELVEDGEKMTFYKGAMPDMYDQDYDGPRITRGKPYFGSHHEDSVALFFYENMQGTGKDKRQDHDGDHELDAPGLPSDPTYINKDDKPYGSYIEVDAYYVSINSRRLGSGDIKYRFMLGQNETTDYNARRNCHYKLTLKLKNFANDVDWHIEYEEPEPGVITPDPYFISYLYNHQMEYPIKINTGGYEIESIKAEIVVNRWNPNTTDRNAYCPDLIESEEDNPWNGFLSLHKTMKTVVTSDRPYTVTSNYQHYIDPPKRGEREYKVFDVGTHATDGLDDEDTYRVEADEDKENTYNVFVPMYTCAKQLVKETAYTGNNPYTAYQRKAKVFFRIKLKDGPEFQKTVTIYQVRRVVNPKGIYRDHDGDKDFHVVLKRLPSENATKFTSFASEGPWKAYVVRWCNSKGPGDRVINLEASSPYSELKDDTIFGYMGSEIDFKVKFNGTCNADVSRYAVIRVEYHNYTCQHLIFVRQGDCSDALLENGTRWHTKNMRTATLETDSPIEEGSLFRRGVWDYPIDALNNKNPAEDKGGYWINVKPSDFKDGKTTKFGIATDDRTNTDSLLWSDVRFTNHLGDFQIKDDVTWRVAEEDDYQALYKSDDIEQGYGVLYGNEAEETLDDLNEVYGYDYTKPGTWGMRGCFVYNKLNGKNLFFPIGASGYGHRKNGLGEDGKVAVLRYAASRSSYFPNGQIGDGSTYPNGVKDAPLFWDIFMRPGAVYWYGKSSIDQVGWDINYFSFDFYEISNYATGGGKDACFVRCVDKTK